MSTIRNYIDIINSVAPKQNLTESNSEFSFLRELINEGRHDDLISQTVTSLKTKFKDNEEAVSAVDKAERLWNQIRTNASFKRFPNKWKMFMAENIRQHMFYIILDKSQLGIEDPKLAKRMNRTVKEQDVRRLFSEFEHYTAFLNHSPIANFDPFGSDDPVAELHALQTSMQSVNDEWLEASGDETLIIDMGQYKWFDLGKGACKEEGNAMGHCGNAPSVRAGDTIYSLRQVLVKDGVTYHRPSLTFIANNGVLGEMKGRANNKPHERYHPHIVELLKSKYVTAMKGGGYDPDNNFHPDDLSKEHWDEVEAVKGKDFMELSPLVEVRRVVKMIADGSISSEDAERALQEVIEEVSYEQGYDEISISGFDEENNLLLDVSFIKDAAEGYWGYVEGDEYIDVDPYVNSYDDHLNEGESHIVEQTIDYIHNTYEEDIKEYFDLEDDEYSREFVENQLDEIIKELAYDVKDAIDTADRYARESGIQSEIYNALNLLVQQVAIDHYAIPKKTYELIDEKPEFTLKVPLDKVEKLFKDYHDGTLEDETYRLDVPYYGFDGYDEEHYRESLVDQLSEFIDFEEEEEDRR